MTNPIDGATDNGLARVLGFREAVTLILGGVIGVSIFLVPAAVADEAGSPIMALVAWSIAGILAVAAALCFAELSAAMPQSGGTYVFLKRAYPRAPVGFLFVWMMFFAYATGAIAVVSIMATSYAWPLFGPDVSESSWQIKSVAITAILFLTAINYAGVRLGGAVQNILTSAKIGLMVILIVSAYLWEVPIERDSIHWRDLVGSDVGLNGLGSAIVLCLFSYSGAYFVTHVAEEIQNPERNIPRAIVVGMGLVLILYMLINFAYFRVLPFEEVRSSTQTAADMMVVILGPKGAVAVAITVTMSAVAVLNAQLLNYPRIMFAAARDRVFFSRLAKIHPTHHTPANAIAVVGVIASAFVLVGSYREILTYVGFVVHCFMCLTVLAVIVLRIREPNLDRPYRVWGYPVTPILFLVISGWYLTDLFVARPFESLVGVSIVLVGLPFYFYWQSRQGRSSLADDNGLE